MSFTLTVWQQPAGLLLPRDVDEVQAQLDRVSALPAGGPQPVFAAFVRALRARCPGDVADDAVYDASLAGLEQGPCELHYNLGLWTGSESLANGQALALGAPRHGLRAYGTAAWHRCEIPRRCATGAS